MRVRLECDACTDSTGVKVAIKQEFDCGLYVLVGKFCTPSVVHSPKSLYLCTRLTARDLLAQLV